MDDTIQACVEKLHDTFERTDLDVEWKKIEQKLEEARYNPGDVTPLADCILSILLAARSRGFSVKSVFMALDRIAAENLNRRWKRMDDGTYQAV
jgi:hypothetical protein